MKKWQMIQISNCYLEALHPRHIVRLVKKGFKERIVAQQTQYRLRNARGPDVSIYRY